MREEKTERYLDTGHYAWEYQEKVALDRIDKKKSRANPSRASQRIDEDRVIQYGLAKEEGAEFPALVLLKLDGVESGKPDLLVITGMHRLGGYELANVVETDAYIVNELDDYRIDSLLYSINNIEGRAPTQAEQILKLLALHERYPTITVAQLAKEWHIRRESISHVERIQKGKQRAREAGYDFDRMKVGSEAVKVMAGIWDDLVFEKACAFINNHDPTVGQIQEMCKDIRQAPHEQRAGVEVIKKYIEAAEFEKKEQNAKHGRVPQGSGEKHHSKCKSLLREIERGVDHLHVSAMARPSDLKIVWEALIKAGKRVIMECERVEEARSRRQAAMRETRASA